jgi:hypothetical protein
LIYLRARYYTPTLGRFLTKDTWAGDSSHPLSFNAWNYVDGNPINYADPTGQCPQGWRKNSNGTCSFSFFTFLPGGGVTFTVPESLTWLFCDDQTAVFQQPYSTPTVTPHPITPTPGSLIITPTPIQTQVNGTPTSTPTAQPTPYNSLYHYGTAAKIAFIISAQLIPASNEVSDPDRARYGAGVYFTDIVPGSMTKGQIARRLYGSPHLGNQAHVAAWVLIDLSGLTVIYNAPYNYVVPVVGGLPVEGRIISSGVTP